MNFSALPVHLMAALALYESLRHICIFYKTKRKDYIPFEVLKICLILGIWSALYFWVLKD